MPITSSIGYDGTVTEAPWAFLAPTLGSPCAVAGRDDWRVTIGGTGDRAVTVAVGVGFGWGIRDHATTTTNLNADAPGAGMDRWDAVVCRRAWGTNTSSLTLVKGVDVAPGTPPTVPAISNVSPGGTHDWVFALLRVRAGQATVQEVVDRRLWTGRALFADSKAALLPAGDAGYGALAMVGGVQWQVRSVGGVLTWVDHDDLPWTLAGGGALAPETGTASGELRNGEVALAGNLRRVNGNPLPFAGEDVILATFPRAWAPEYAQRFTVPTEQRHVFAELFVDGNHDTGSGFIGRLGMLAPTEASLATFKRVHLSPVRWRPRGPL